MLAKSLLATLLATRVAAAVSKLDIYMEDTAGRPHGVDDIPISNKWKPKFFNYGPLQTISLIAVMTPPEDWPKGVCYFYAGRGTSSIVVAVVRPGDGDVKVDLDRSQEQVFWVECSYE